MVPVVGSAKYLDLNIECDFRFRSYLRQLFLVAYRPSIYLFMCGLYRYDHVLQRVHELPCLIMEDGN